MITQSVLIYRLHVVQEPLNTFNHFWELEDISVCMELAIDHVPSQRFVQRLRFGPEGQDCSNVEGSNRLFLYLKGPKRLHNEPGLRIIQLPQCGMYK